MQITRNFNTLVVIAFVIFLCICPSVPKSSINPVRAGDNYISKTYIVKYGLVMHNRHYFHCYIYGKKPTNNKLLHQGAVRNNPAIFIKGVFAWKMYRQFSLHRRFTVWPFAHEKRTFCFKNSCMSVDRPGASQQSRPLFRPDEYFLSPFSNSCCKFLNQPCQHVTNNIKDLEFEIELSQSIKITSVKEHCPYRPYQIVSGPCKLSGFRETGTRGLWLVGINWVWQNLTVYLCRFTPNICCLAQLCKPFYPRRGSSGCKQES